MCGICGFTGKADIGSLEKMTGAIFHRGPDEDGYYSSGKINLGIRRLSIIDVETGHQPVHNEDKTLWLVFNGEIYNYIELREELEGKGHRFYTSHSDSETLVHLYEEYGLDFVHKLNGMFAVALWDTSERKLLLIRDRMGVKPLFYAPLGGNIVFGSELKAILDHPDYKRNPNFDALYHYFSFKCIPAPHSAFEGIYSLSPGEMLTYSDGDITTRRWWKVRYDENEDYDEQEIIHKISSLLEDATRLRMRSDVPFGAYLSGGVDSSTVVALMKKFSVKPVETFCLGYEDELQNKEADLYFAREVSESFGTNHHEYIMSHKELIDDVESIIGSFDQPFSGTISTYFLSKLIKKHVKVALSGDGADELFGSYLTHRVAQPMHHFKRLYGKIKPGQFSQEQLKLFSPCEESFLEDLYKRSGGDEVRWRYNLSLFSDEEKRGLLTRDFMGRCSNDSSFGLLKKQFSRLTASNPLNRILEMEWNTQLPDQVLAFVDFLSMAHSVEVRSPFLDYRLVEFVAKIPGQLKIRDGVVKDILKKAVRPLLPPGITERPKEGFVLPIFDWMVEKFKGYTYDLLSPERLGKHNLLNHETVKHLLEDHYSGRRNNPGKIWNLMMFQVWWERYFG